MDGLPRDHGTSLTEVQSTGGLLIALLTLAAIAWVAREVTGQRNGPSVPVMLAARWRACWPALRAFWRWWLSL